MYWGVIDPEGGRSTNNILLQGRLKICDQFTDVFVCEWAAADQEHKGAFLLTQSLLQIIAFRLAMELSDNCI